MQTISYAFVSGSPLPCRAVHHSIRNINPRRPRIPLPCSPPSMTGKGFGTKPTKPSGKPKKENSRGDISNSSTPSDQSSDSFLPRGPTLRSEYEKKGLIEPSISPDDGVLPEIVANRMLRRILTFGGIPLTGLFSFFALYFVLKYKYDITVIPVLVAYTTLGTIGLSTLGISYGIFSSSWDEDIEGSKLGWDEARSNILRARDGLLGQRELEIREDRFDEIDRAEEERKQRSKTEDSEKS